MKFITKNGVTIDFDNNIIDTMPKNTKPLLVLDKNNLKEVNLNGYIITKIDDKQKTFGKGTIMRIDENVNHIFINNKGIVISDDNGKVINVSRESLLQILQS